MRFLPSAIDGVVPIELEWRGDARGGLARTFCAEEFAEAGIAFRVVQANRTTNPVLHTLRGMHFQRAPHGEPKIISCRRGRILDVAVDVRRGSPTFLAWQGLELAGDDGRLLYLAPGIAHGFLTLTPDCELDYLMGAPYVPEAASGLRWDDPAVGIAWPAEPRVISGLDRARALVGEGAPDYEA